MKRYPISTLLNHVKPGIPYFILAASIGATVAVLEQEVPVRLQALINGFIKSGRDFKSIADPAIIIIVLIFAGQISRYLQRLSAGYANSLVSANLILKAFMCQIARPIGSFAQDHTAVLQGKLDRSARGIAELLKILFSDLLISVLGVCMAVALILKTDRHVGYVVLIVVPVLTMLTLIQARSQAGVRLKLEHWRQRISKSIAEAFRGLEEIKLFRAESHQAKSLASDLRDATRQEFVHQNAMARFDLLKSLIDRCGFISVLGFAFEASMQNGSDLGLGGVLMLTLLYERAVDPIRHLHRIIDEGIEKLQLVQIYLELLSIEPIERKPRLNICSTDVILENVSFGYSGQSHQVIRELSVTIPGGSIVAVQGRSGCGKSTVQRLLAGLYVPTTGSIQIGGQPVDPIELRESYVAVLSQSPHIFSGSIKENIKFARPEASDAEVEEAARLAYFHDEVVALNGSYDYNLGESGQGLSGGQQQRLALARIFLARSPVIILDEPTASLDPENSKRILSQMRTVFAGSTVIVVTHESGALLWADYALKFDDTSRTFTFHALEASHY
ncbi:MAG: ABC transporter ATP-binding protein [Chthonomonadales bacterium]